MLASPTFPDTTRSSRLSCFVTSPCRRTYHHIPLPWPLLEDAWSEYCFDVASITLSRPAVTTLPDEITHSTARTAPYHRLEAEFDVGWDFSRRQPLSAETTMSSVMGCLLTIDHLWGKNIYRERKKSEVKRITVKK